MNTINTYIGNKPPKNSNTIWLRPLKQGGVGFYVWVNNKWNTIKLMDSKGSRTPMDDTPIDIDGDSDHYYTKDLIDDKFADILGLDASGIAELKALLEDDDAMTGLLTAVNNKYDKVNGIQLSSESGEMAPIPFVKVDYGDGVQGSVELSSGQLKFNGGTGEGSYNLHASFISVTDRETGKTNPAGIHYPKYGDDTFDNNTIARVCDIDSKVGELSQLSTSTKVSAVEAINEVKSNTDTALLRQKEVVVFDEQLPPSETPYKPTGSANVGFYNVSHGYIDVSNSGVNTIDGISYNYGVKLNYSGDYYAGSYRYFYNKIFVNKPGVLTLYLVSTGESFSGKIKFNVSNTDYWVEFTENTPFNQVISINNPVFDNYITYRAYNNDGTAIELPSGTANTCIVKFEFQPSDYINVSTEKQNTLTAGSNITINNDIISAIDTTYSVLKSEESGEDKSLVSTNEKYDYEYSADQFKNYLITDYTYSYGDRVINVTNPGVFTFKGQLFGSWGIETSINVSVELTRNNETTTIASQYIARLGYGTFNVEQYVKAGDVITVSSPDSPVAGDLITEYRLKTITSREQLSDYIKKSQTAGLIKNDGTVDTSSYLTSHQSIKTINSNSIVGTGDVSVITGVKVGTNSLTPYNGVVTISTTDTPTSVSASLMTSGGVYDALQNYETKLKFSTSSSTSLSAARNTYYRFTNTPSSLSITLPTSSLIAGDQCGFSFTTSNSFSASGFTISGGTVKKMKDFAIASSKTYEVVALYDGAKWLVTETEFE